MKNVLALLAVLLFGAACFAAQIPVASYSMLNGAEGGFDYHDFTYVPCNGNCGVTGAPLSGGTGKLTDGVSPTTSWDQEGVLTQWVGWDSNQGLLDPTVTFLFGNSVTIRSVTIWVDNTIGRGNVYLPSSVTIGGTNFLIPPDNVNPNPRAYTFDTNITGSSVDVQFFQTPGWSWIMVGEVSFYDTSQNVPEPATLTLAAAGLAAGWWKRRAKRT
jgi:PEP-CTERM motif-containing protein